MPWRALDVVPHRDVLVEGGPDGVVGADVLRQPVADPLALGRVGPEELVPDDQDAAVVAVEVDLVGAVVDPVMGRRVEDGLERPGQLPDPLGVDPELVDQRPGLREQDHPGLEPERRHPQPERQVGHRHPRLPQRGREVVVGARVVDDVAGPEEPALVAAAVEPVVGEVVGEEEQHPGQRVARIHPQRRQLVDQRVERDDDELPGDVDDDVAGAEQEARAGVGRVVADHVLLVAGVAERERLDRQQQDEEGDRVVEDLGHGSI